MTVALESFLGGLAAPLHGGDEVAIIPALAGGRSATP